jgi:hypothetical protein
MAGLVPPPKVGKHRTLPPEARQAILDAKREHPALNRKRYGLPKPERKQELSRQAGVRLDW